MNLHIGRLFARSGSLDRRAQREGTSAFRPAPPTPTSAFDTTRAPTFEVPGAW
jgi:hypothetical protein